MCVREKRLQFLALCAPPLSPPPFSVDCSRHQVHCICRWTRFDYVGGRYSISSCAFQLSKLKQLSSRVPNSPQANQRRLCVLTPLLNLIVRKILASEQTHLFRLINYQKIQITNPSSQTGSTNLCPHVDIHIRATSNLQASSTEYHHT